MTTNMSVKNKQLTKQEQLKVFGSLKISKSLSDLQRDREYAEGLQALQDEKDSLNDQIGKEAQSLKDIKREISDMELKLLDLRKEGGDREAQKTEAQRTETAIQKLEDKLGRASAHLSEQLAKNSRLREELQSFYRERVRFLHMHKRFTKELQDMRKNNQQMINQTAIDSDARVDAQSKMTTMRADAIKALAYYNTERKDMERLLAHQQSLKEFMSTKHNQRGKMDNYQEMGQRRQVKEQQRMDSDNDSLDVVEKIKTEAGVNNLDKFVNMYIEGEDSNLALFNAVNEQNNKAEAMRDEIKQIEEQMEDVRLTDLQQESDHCSSLRELEEQQMETEVQALDFEEKVSVISNILEETTEGVRNIFYNMDCDRSAIEAMLGVDIMSYLCMVEQRTDELLTLQALHSDEDQTF